jgi:hypothetical protein
MPPDLERIARIAKVLIQAAFASRDVQRHLRDLNSPRLWTVEGVSRNLPCRVEWEHAVVIGGVGESLAAARHKNWGEFIGVLPLEPTDSVHWCRLLYVYKESSPYNRRVEQRKSLKRLLGRRHRKLVTEASRSTKKEAVRRTAKTPIVDEQRFILSTRDTGHRSTASAVAELVDNSVQAGATWIRIFVNQDGIGVERRVQQLAVLDNGCGVDAVTLTTALRFGGSSRFDDRSGPGRFGMGLPNCSVSQANRTAASADPGSRSTENGWLPISNVPAQAGASRQLPGCSTADTPSSRCSSPPGSWGSSFRMTFDPQKTLTLPVISCTPSWPKRSRADATSCSIRSQVAAPNRSSLYEVIRILGKDIKAFLEKTRIRPRDGGQGAPSPSQTEAGKPFRKLNADRLLAAWQRQDADPDQPGERSARPSE